MVRTSHSTSRGLGIANTLRPSLYVVFHPKQTPEVDWEHPNGVREMGLHDALVVVGYGDDFRMYRKMLQQYFSKSRSETYRPMQIREARILAQNLVSSPSRRGELLIRFLLFFFFLNWDKVNETDSRYSAAIIIEIAYGHRILTDNDPYVKIAEDVCHASAHSGPPGGTPVDIFPFRKS
ncbi:hypothetical protein H0H81_010078 [Sphagnurus paluster]|uniref:Uncharacterized protein n=1 Tax=Sphagnurus paluster TaxID=117069 RepID=A0A9P7KIM3_9AGAR|nr:hypothetical protein H0H81_010078 [Sphagnurus paluster]